MESSSILQTDFASPRSFSQTQGRDYIFPTITSPLLPPEVLQQLLAFVYQDSEIPLVDLILLTTLQQHVLCEDFDLGGQDSHLNFRASGIWTRTRCLLHLRVGIDGSSCTRPEDIIGDVAAKGINAALDVRSRPILLVAILQGDNTLNSGNCSLVILGVLPDLFSFPCWVLDVSICGDYGLSKDVGVLEGGLDVGGFKEVVQTAGGVSVEAFNGGDAGEGLDEGS